MENNKILTKNMCNKCIYKINNNEGWKKLDSIVLLL